MWLIALLGGCQFNILEFEFLKGLLGLLQVCVDSKNSNNIFSLSRISSALVSGTKARYSPVELALLEEVLPFVTLEEP